MFRRRYIALAAISLTVASPAHADREDWDRASDIALGGLLIGAAAAPVAQEDWEGLKQAGLTWLVAEGITTGLKENIRAERPDGSDHKSFPSGHTSQSFAAAGTMHRRYGWKVGIPAHAIATFVGVARVKAKKHFVRDVLVGAAIGEGSAWLYTKPKNDKVQWLPWGDAHGGGVHIAYKF
jgi:membrane-associated phospholipid phosphatase